jgi:hypothetical protein
MMGMPRPRFFACTVMVAASEGNGQQSRASASIIPEWELRAMRGTSAP